MDDRPVAGADPLWQTETLADPYPVYAQLRSASPFRHMLVPAGHVPGLEEPVMSWALLRHDHVYRVLRDHETFTSAQSPLARVGIYPRLVLIMDDPPRHTRFRRLVNRTFTQRRIETMAPWITRIAG